jgi:hypothetical protein
MTICRPFAPLAQRDFYPLIKVIPVSISRLSVNIKKKRDLDCNASSR